MKGFLKEFVTPLIKVSKGDFEKCFFTVSDFNQWAKDKQMKNFKIKYYKGLGTSTEKEAQQYFGAINFHRLQFIYLNEDDS